MADRYWVGGSGTWDTTSTTNWSTSSGGSSGASVPTSADNVIFDANSNTGTNPFTVSFVTGAQLNCNDLTASGLDGTLTFARLGFTGSVTLNVYGSWSTPATNFTFSGVSFSIIFQATTTGKTINTGNVNFLTTSFQFAGSGGEWTLQSDFTATFGVTDGGTISQLRGTLNTNGYTVTIRRHIFSNSGVTATLNLGSSVFIITGTGFGDTSSNFVCNGGTSTIRFTNDVNPTSSTGLSVSNNTSLYDVEFTSTTATGAIDLNSVSGSTPAFSVRNLTINGLASSGLKRVNVGGNITVTGTLSLNSSSPDATARLAFISNGEASRQRTLTVATAGTIRDVDFAEITFAGAASPLVGTSLRFGDIGGNTGITFPATKSVYWNLPAGGAWAATAWALSSGGSVSVNNFPLPQDNALFDNTGLTSGATVTLNASYYIGTITTSARTTPMTLAGGSSTIFLYKNLTFNNVVTFTSSASPNIIFSGIGTAQLIDCPGMSFPGTVLISNVSGGSATLLNNLTCGSFSVISGTLNLSNQTVIASGFGVSGNNITINFGASGAFNLSGAGVVYNFVGTGNVFTGSRVVNFTNAGPTAVTVNPGSDANALIAANFSSGSYNVTFGSFPYLLSLNTTGKTSGSFSSTNDLRLYGNLTLSAGVVFSSVLSVSFYANATLTSNTVTLPNISFGASSVVLTLGSALTGNSISFNAGGTLTLSNFNLTLAGSISCSISGTPNVTINFGTGIITFTSLFTFSFRNSSAVITITGTNPTANHTVSGGGTMQLDITAGTWNGPSINCNFSAGFYTITSASGQRFNNLNFTGYSGTYNPSFYTITVTGNITFSSGMTASGTGSFVLTGAGTKTLDFAGRSFSNSLSLTGTTSGSATYTLTSGGFTAAGGIALTGPSSGAFSLTFNTGSFNFSTGAILSTLQNTSGLFDLIWGSSVVTITSSSGVSFTYNGTTSYTPISWSGAPGITFSATATNAPLRLLPPNVFLGGNFGTVTWAALTNITADIPVVGTNTYAALTLPTRTTSGSSRITFNGNQTITGNLNFGGSATRANRVVISPAFVGAGAVVISAGSVSGLQNIDFIRVDANGAAIPWSGTDLGDGGGNSDITFAAGVTKYWSLVGGGGWTAVAWASSSGGTPTAADFPLLQDTALIEDTGLNSGASITFSGVSYVGNIDSSTRTLPFTLAFSTAPFFVRDVNFSTATSYSGSSGCTFLGGGVQNLILPNAFPISSTINSQELRLQPASSFTGSFTSRVTLSAGTLNLNGNAVDVLEFYSPGSAASVSTASINFSSSARINITRTADNFTNPVANIANPDLTYTGTSDFRLTGASTSGQTRTVTGAATTTSITNWPNLRVSSGASGSIVTPQLAFNNIDYTGSSSNANHNAVRISGNLTMASGQTVLVPGVAANRSILFVGSGTQSITSNSVTFTVPISVRNNSAGGTVSLADSFASSSDIYVENGIFATNNQSVSVNNFRVAAELVDANPKTINLGSSGITITGSGANAWDTNNANTTVNAGSSVISFTSTSNRTFNGGNKTFATVRNSNSLGALTIAGSPTISTLTNTVWPSQFNFTAGTTTTVTNFSLIGALGALTSIRSTVPGTRATLSKASGTVSVSFLDIQDSQATGGASWQAYVSNNNVNSGNNLGWDFGAVFVDGVSATGEVGQVQVPGTNVAYVTGVSATGEVNSVTVLSNDIQVNVSGTLATGFVGVPFVPDNIVVYANGVAGTGLVGVPTVSIGSSVSVDGVLAFADVNNVTVTTDQFISVSGVSCQGLVGGLFSWVPVVEGNIPGWVAIPDSQVANWQLVNNNSSTTWTSI